MLSICSTPAISSHSSWISSLTYPNGTLNDFKLIGLSAPTNITVCPVGLYTAHSGDCLKSQLSRSLYRITVFINWLYTDPRRSTLYLLVYTTCACRSCRITSYATSLQKLDLIEPRPPLDITSCTSTSPANASCTVRYISTKSEVISVIGTVHNGEFSRFSFSSRSILCFSAMVKAFSNPSIALSWLVKSGANPLPSFTSPFAILLLRSWISARLMMSRCCSFSMRSICSAI